MSCKRRLIVAAVLGVLVTGAGALGLYVNGRERQSSYLDELVYIPLVIGKTERDARAAIERVGLRPTVEYRYFRPRHSRVGRVIGQSPVPRIVSPGCSVMIVVSSAERRPRRDSPGDLAWTNYAPLVPAALRQTLLAPPPAA
jgi:hypothetical protein